MRYPNPWIAAPSLLAGALAAWVGFVVTDVSCRVEVDGVVQTCTGWAVGIAVTSFAVATIGMAVVLVLVYRSIAEARERDRAD